MNPDNPSLAKGMLVPNRHQQHEGEIPYNALIRKQLAINGMYQFPVIH
jgi:hypothetical protein